jgi:heme-degrading monooxygenase HmoA
MIARIWRTHIADGQDAEYDSFATSRSIPMFHAQPGFLGILLAHDGTERLVISLWQDTSCVQALHQAPCYNETVRALEATRILQGPSTIQLLELDQCLFGDLEAD